MSAKGGIERTSFRNIESERSAIGAMLIEPRAIGAAMRCLHPAHFYFERHGAVYLCLVQMYRAAQVAPAPIDLTTVAGELYRRGKLAEIGGAAYLTACIGTCPNAAQIGAYAGAVIEAAQYRALHGASDILRAAVCAQDGMKRSAASTLMEAEPMHAPAKLTAALRKFADGIDAMGQAKPAPDLKQILEMNK